MVFYLMPTIWVKIPIFAKVIMNLERAGPKLLLLAGWGSQAPGGSLWDFRLGWACRRDVVLFHAGGLQLFKLIVKEIF